MPLQARRVQNSPSLLQLVNKGRKRSMPAKKRGKRKSTKSRGGTKRKSYAKKAPSSRSYKRNPAPKRKSNKKRRSYASSKKRRSSPKRRNPGFGLQSGVSAEIVNFTGASLILSTVGPIVQPLLNPITRMAGQYQPAVNAAATGLVLGWAADKFGPTRRFSKALQILGISTAVISLVAPLVSKFIGGGRGAGPQGAWPSNGRAGWARGPNGWAVVTGTPPQILSPAQAAAQGPNGWTTMRQGYRNA